jgi:hypothetical protein
MLIVALDPGGTTGVATYESANQTWERLQLERDHHEQLYDLLVDWEPDVIVCERFLYQRREINKGVSLRLDSVEYIGVTRLYCKEHNVELVMQTASQAKGLWTDIKLKKVGLWIPGKVHAMDATRHLLYYITVAMHDSTYVMKLKPSAE